MFVSLECYDFLTIYASYSFMQQDMKFKCLVSKKVVNFADKEELEETIEACIGDIDAVMEELNPNQEGLITYLVTKLVPTKQQNKQLSLMLKTKAWKNECTNTEYTMQNIFIREQLEKDSYLDSDLMMAMVDFTAITLVPLNNHLLVCSTIMQSMSKLQHSFKGRILSRTF